MTARSARLNRHAGAFVEVSRTTVTAGRAGGGGLAAHRRRLRPDRARRADPRRLRPLLRAARARRRRPATACSASARPTSRSRATGSGSPPAPGSTPAASAKGLAADLVCAELLAAGAEGVCVNLGGDVRVCGAGPDGNGWTVAVEHPWSAHARSCCSASPTAPWPPPPRCAAAGRRRRRGAATISSTRRPASVRHRLDADDGGGGRGRGWPKSWPRPSCLPAPPTPSTSWAVPGPRAWPSTDHGRLVETPGLAAFRARPFAGCSSAPGGSRRL